MKRILWSVVAAALLSGCVGFSIMTIVKKDPETIVKKEPVLSPVETKSLQEDATTIYNKGTKPESPEGANVKKLADKAAVESAKVDASPTTTIKTGGGCFLSGWSVSFPWEWYAIGIIGLVILLSAAQAYTGIPFLTTALAIVKGIFKTLWWILKQVKHIYIALKPAIAHVMEHLRPAAVAVKNATVKAAQKLKAKLPKPPTPPAVA